MNFYTQFSYNKWHKVQEACPLSNEIPEYIFHVMLHCRFANTLWNHMEPLLMLLSNIKITNEEKAFGIIRKKQTTEILLRNWLTYFLRENIMDEERKAYHTQKKSKFKRI